MKEIRDSVRALSADQDVSMVSVTAKGPLARASGRYSHIVSKSKTLRQPLKCISAQKFESFIAEAPKDQLVLVCCFGDWYGLLSLTHVTWISNFRIQGSLVQTARTRAFVSEWFVDIHLIYCDGDAGELLRDAQSRGQPCSYTLVKFDMGHSRYLNDRYGIRAIPMYLGYYGMI